MKWLELDYGRHGGHPGHPGQPTWGKGSGKGMGNYHEPQQFGQQPRPCQFQGIRITMPNLGQHLRLPPRDTPGQPSHLPPAPEGIRTTEGTQDIRNTQITRWLEGSP